MNCPKCGKWFDMTPINGDFICNNCQVQPVIPYYGNITNPEFCPICNKLMNTQEELYWHLRIHKEKLTPPTE